MSCKTTREKIEVMEAFEWGETIQTYDKLTERWVDWRTCVIEPKWCWGMYDYRIKPKPREWWLHISPCGAGEVIHRDREHAKAYEQMRGDPLECVHVREVLEEV